MNTSLLSLLTCACALTAAEVQAQTVLMVPYGKANFHWDAPVDPPPQGVGITRYHALNCGGADVRVDVPAISIAVNTVVSQPGQYSCTIKAGNNFGESATVPFPTFEAGYIPATPENSRIEIR